MITVDIVGTRNMVDRGACGAVGQTAVALDSFSKELELSN